MLEFLWTPYLQSMVNRLVTINVSPIIRAFVHLICFAIVEFHQIDQVAKQFGWRQSIPPDLINLDEVHRINLRGRTNINWTQYHH